MIEIAFLADHLEAIPTLIDWFSAQWPVYFAEFSEAKIAEDFHSEALREGLSIRLLAFADGELAGTITLREHAIHTHPEYQPGLGGLFVHERFRGRGIGTELVRAGMDLARAQGGGEVFATTVHARGILERLGWVRIRVVQHDGEELDVYRGALDPRGMPGPASQSAT